MTAEQTNLEKFLAKVKDSKLGGLVYLAIAVEMKIHIAELHSDSMKIPAGYDEREAYLRSLREQLGGYKKLISDQLDSTGEFYDLLSSLLKH